MESNERNINDIPKVFISYSWTSDEHIENVENLAKRLMSDGVDVLLDLWDAPEGIDLNYYMEKVKSKEIDFVLIICDQEYATKADQRKGGVGTETQIISKEVYNNVEQTRVIPIIYERDDEGEPCVPTYLASRKFIDLINDYNDGYERLLRRIHNVPEHIKPPIGEFPVRLKVPKVNNGTLESIIFSFVKRVEKDQFLINNIIQEFLEEFFDCIKKNQITFSSNETEDIVKVIYDKIFEYIPLRDSFIKFFKKIIKYTKYSGFEIDFDNIIDFFGRLFNLTIPKVGETFDRRSIIYYDFIIRELFLYLITISLHYKNYDFISNVLNSPYYFKSVYNPNETQNFLILDQRGDIETDKFLTYYYTLKDKNYITGLGHMLIERMYSDFDINEFVEADLLCCYISIINLKDKYGWFPYTHIYKESEDFELFRKLTSKKHFEKVKDLFEVETVEDLKEKIQLADNYFSKQRYGFSRAIFSYVKPIGHYVKLDEIYTLR